MPSEFQERLRYLSQGDKEELALAFGALLCMRPLGIPVSNPAAQESFGLHLDGLRNHQE